ncbi:MAG: alpha-amylase domain-containing protein [Flavobacteriales bacterium]
MKKIVLSVLTMFFLVSATWSQTTVKKVVLQAFWWDYYNSNYNDKWANYLAELAPRLKSMGIDAIWIPPCSKNESPYYVGYAPFDHYDLGDKFQKGSTRTRLGNKDELLRLIAVMHANGIEVIQDVVLNHVNSAGSANGAGGQDPNSYSMATNSGYKNFRYVCYNNTSSTESQSEYWARTGRWPKNYTNFYPNQYNNCTTGDICSPWFGADISYESSAYGQSSNVVGFNPVQSANHMRDNGRNWMMWLKKQTGVDGFRWDAVKHFPTNVQEDFSYNMKYSLPTWCKGGQNMFNVGEWVGSKSELDSYVNTIAAPSGEKMMGTFDFNLRGFDPSGGLYGMVYGMGNFDMATLPAAQQNERVAYYSGSNTYVHRTVTFVNNHDTFRPQLNASGNYTGWNTGSELSPHIEPNEPRSSAAYAVIFAMDGNPQIFFEDLFDIGYNGNRWNHDPKSTTGLPARNDLVNLIWCHQALDFKSGAYQVPHTSADYLIIDRAGKAIIGITDNWSTWQNQWVHTNFAPGTVLKDYSGANGNTTVTVDANGWAPINTPPVNPALNVAGRKGYSVWAPTGKDGIVYTPSRPTATTQEWEMANDLGDKHASSLTQGGAIPASSTNFRTVGKIYVESGKTVNYVLYPENATKSLYIGLYNTGGTLLASKSGLGTLTGSYLPNFTGWITVKVRNNVSSNPAQKCWVNITYTAPAIVLVANSTSSSNEVAVWSGNGNSSDWLTGENWEDGVLPAADRDVIVPGNAFPQPAIHGGMAVNNITIEEGAHLFVEGELVVNGSLNNSGEITGSGNLMVDGNYQTLQGITDVMYSIYPNPANGEVHLFVNGYQDPLSEMQLNLHTSEGKLIAEIRGYMIAVDQELNNWIGNAAAGVYFIHVIGDDAQAIRLVVEK